MRNDQNIRYIQSPSATDFPDEDVANLAEELIRSEVKYDSDQTRHAVESVLRDTSRGPSKDMCKIRDQGNTIIAKDGEKTVGMIGYEKHHFSPLTGQKIVEIRRNTVLTDYRGLHIGRGLRERMIKHLQKMDPDALLLSRIHKRNTVNLNLGARTGFKQVTSDDMRRLGFTEEYIDGALRSGYEFYIFDPRNNSSQETDREVLGS